MSRKKRILLAVAVVAVVFGYRQWSASSASDTPTKADETPLTVQPTAPLTLGRIAFKPCNLPATAGSKSLEAQCATYEVPEDRANPQGRKIALNLAWVPSSGRGDTEPDPVFFIAGGPGQSAVETYPGIDPVFTEVRKNRDVILLDQRGTGKSNLLNCDTQEDQTDISATAFEKFAQQCLEKLSAKADLRHYTTTDAIADLEEVRKAIGAEKINLVGVSYGTRVAQQYAMRYPASTRSIVLDSVVPNAQPLGNIFARNLEDALALQFAQCTKNPTCKDSLGDPGAELEQLLTKLRAAPVTVRYRDASTGELQEDQLHAASVAGLVRMYAYMPVAASLLPKLIHEANAGRYEGLMALSKMMQEQMQDSMAMGMQLSVVCSEDRGSMVARDEDANTVLGNSMAEGMAAMCKAWPSGKAPTDFNKALATDVPALLVSGEFDPVTPPRYGNEVLKTLPNGRHFVLRGQGHSVLGAGCMPKLFAQFIEKGDAKSLDGKCLDTLGYAVPFTTYNGAEP